MYDVLREIIVYATFLSAVTVITYLNRSPWEPLYNRQLTNMFVGGPYEPYSITKVSKIYKHSLRGFLLLLDEFAGKHC